jgi:hypothetical protein
LLDLHDFPGQGTALVGVLDPFWGSKGYVTPEEYSRFCNATVPLARLDQRVFTTDETIDADLEVAHFGAAPLENAITTWRLVDGRDKVVAQGELDINDQLFLTARIRNDGASTFGLAHQRAWRNSHIYQVPSVQPGGNKLQFVQILGQALGRHRRFSRSSQRREAGRWLVHGVAMTHPARLLGRRIVEQAAVLGHREPGAPELAYLGALYAPAQLQHHRLHAVADAEHGNPKLEQLRSELWGAVRIDRRRPAGEDQAARPAPRDLLQGDVVR